MNGARIGMIVFTLLLAAQSAAAQGVSVVAQTVSEAYAGDVIPYEVVVRGGELDTDPDISAITEFPIRSVGPPSRSSQKFSQTIGGKRTDWEYVQYTYRYEIVAPSSAGAYTIPPVIVHIEGQPYSTKQLRFRIKEPSQTDEFPVRLTLAKRDLYVGEPVTAHLEWYCIVDFVRRPISMRLALDSSDFEVFNAPQLPLTRDDLQSGRFVEITFNGRAAYATISQRRVNDRMMSVIAFDTILQPRRAGSLSTGKAAVTFEGVVGRDDSGGFFADPFRDRVRTQRFITRAEAVTLNVKPLPNQGRPANFTGLVGEYDIQAFADPTDVNVGDPITLTLRFTGPAPLDRVKPPALEDDRAFTDAFRVSSEPPTITVDGASKTLVRTVRVRRDDVTQIPAIELPYFDTRTGAYGVARSRPIPLIVHATRQVTAADAVGGDGATPGNELEEQTGGIAANIESPEALTNMKTDLRSRLLDPIWMIVMGIPAAAYAAVGTVVLVRRQAARDPAARRRRRALGRAKARLRRAGKSDSADVPTAVSDAVRQYVADRFDEPAAGLTTMDCTRILAVHRVNGADEAEALLRRCDAARFAGAGSDTENADDLPKRALSVVMTIEASMRGEV
ncbi:MAG: BatD family protein [Phycisphaerales bacterium]|nr:BatD family protein [Phycisphaerales bacterium]